MDGTKLQMQINKKIKQNERKTHTFTNTKTMGAIITVHSTYLRSPSQKVFKFPPQTHLHITKTAGSQPFLCISFDVCMGVLIHPQLVNDAASVALTFTTS